MPGTKEEKKKAKRKIKQKERRERPVKALLREKTDFLFYKALWFKDKGQLVKALFYLEKVLRLDPKNEECLQEIPIYLQVDLVAFKESLAAGHLNSLENYQLTLQGHRIRFKETFESLICFNSLKNVRSFWFQEETTRKILKTFHGRALLADEVGLGKTIEALMVLKEYIQRGMVKSAMMI